ncbi:hypothetical protein IIN08_000441 [Escherichia coli]|nr:hypothetical protein [Escherichia coli]
MDAQTRRRERRAEKQAQWKAANPLLVGVSAKPVTRAFDDDVEFQERMAEHIRYMVETIAHHQVDIDSEV